MQFVWFSLFRYRISLIFLNLISCNFENVLWNVDSGQLIVLLFKIDNFKSISIMENVKYSIQNKISSISNIKQNRDYQKQELSQLQIFFVCWVWSLEFTFQRSQFSCLFYWYLWKYHHISVFYTLLEILFILLIKMFSRKSPQESEFVEGLEFPVTLADYETLAEKALNELLVLESEGTSEEKGWLPIEHNYDPTVQVFEKPEQNAISLIRVETILPASPKVIITFLKVHRFQTSQICVCFVVGILLCRKLQMFCGTLISKFDNILKKTLLGLK